MKTKIVGCILALLFVWGVVYHIQQHTDTPEQAAENAQVERDAEAKQARLNQADTMAADCTVRAQEIDPHLSTTAAYGVCAAHFQEEAKPHQ